MCPNVPSRFAPCRILATPCGGGGVLFAGFSPTHSLVHCERQARVSSTHSLIHSGLYDSVSCVPGRVLSRLELTLAVVVALCSSDHIVP